PRREHREHQCPAGAHVSTLEPAGRVVDVARRGHPRTRLAAASAVRTPLEAVGAVGGPGRAVRRRGVEDDQPSVGPPGTGGISGSLGSTSGSGSIATASLPVVLSIAWAAVTASLGTMVSRTTTRPARSSSSRSSPSKHSWTSGNRAPSCRVTRLEWKRLPPSPGGASEPRHVSPVYALDGRLALPLTTRALRFPQPADLDLRRRRRPRSVAGPGSGSEKS